MFETSVVREGVRSRRRYSLFTISVIAHTAVIAGAIGIGLANTTFPTAAPDEVMNAPLILPVSIPPPLGNPNGGAPPRPAATPPQQQAQRPQQQTAPPPETAPNTTPENVPVLDAPSNGDATADGDGRVPGPVGQPWGDEHGTGELDAPPSAIAPIAAPQPDRIYTVGEVTAPVLIKRIEPPYPPALVRAKVNGEAILRCVIDKNGQVRDIQVVYASMPVFGEVTSRAVGQWRYKPASLNGTAVDCYLDVVVHFGVK